MTVSNRRPGAGQTKAEQRIQEAVAQAAEEIDLSDLGLVVLPEAVGKPGFAVCGQRLEITVRFQDVTKGPVKACAYRRSGLGRER